MRVESWTNLAHVSCHFQEMQADVCIVGAGAAGIYLATQLTKMDQSVVLLEAGPEISASYKEVGFDTICEGMYYPGVTEGRFFGMGGTTSYWGGALAPHTELDLREDPVSRAVWEQVVNTVAVTGPKVLKQLGCSDSMNFTNYAETQLKKSHCELTRCGIRTHSALHLPFRRKNFVWLLDKVNWRNGASKVFFNAVAKAWIIEESVHDRARVSSLVAVSENGNKLEVKSQKFIVAAGAIESARILMEINESQHQRVLRPGAAPGRYLADHLSLPIANVKENSRELAAHLFAPRFSDGWMRSFRFLDTGYSNDIPRSFAHFVFPNPSHGFGLAKKLLTAMQTHKLPSVSAVEVLRSMRDIGRLVYSRYMESRLYIPVNSVPQLQIDVEQIPVRNNRVSLSSRRDRYGRFVAKVDWRVSDSDLANIRIASQRFLTQWPGSKLGLPELEPINIESERTKPHDAYHPVGICRMGEDAEAVVDHNLKVWGIENLWVVSTGVLPSAGTANPTFTMLCLAHRLVEHLQQISRLN